MIKRIPRKPDQVTVSYHKDHFGSHVNAVQMSYESQHAIRVYGVWCLSRATEGGLMGSNGFGWMNPGRNVGNASDVLGWTIDGVASRWVPSLVRLRRGARFGHHHVEKQEYVQYRSDVVRMTY